MNPTIRSISLDTPAAIVDAAKMQRNIVRMQRRMDGLAVRLRPHVKTSKCPPIVERQLAAGASGITVSTLAEAEAFHVRGIADILYAVSIVPAKVNRALQLVQRGCRLKLLTDGPVIARELCEVARTRDITPEIWIEVDVDGHRGGLPPDSPQLLETARAIADGHGRLGGVLAHAGSSYGLRDWPALQALAEQERARCVHAAEKLRAEGFDCPGVSVGSTPTALAAKSLPGVTEVRAGVYVFFDLVMVNVGVCTIDDIALSVLATVIGHQQSTGWAIVDAGWMALSRDRGTQKQQTDFGYGAVCDADGHVEDGLIVAEANQEHAMVRDLRADGASLVQRLPVGAQVRILPNHACATGAQHATYHVLAANGSVAAWPRFNGW
jgi:D-serine deaminase-like pyridoxal phosphate-dependent protein